MAIKEKAYHESQNIKNELHLRELMTKLPRFCKQFFMGIEHTTASRTRIAYAYDLGCFFDYLHKENPICSKVDIVDIPISILDQLQPMDIEEYLYHLKLYEKDGNAHANDERAIKRKLSSLRTFYNYFFKNELTKEKMQARLVQNVKLEKNIFVRIIPLFIKKYAMRLGYKLMASTIDTMNFSNLGIARCPEGFENYVERFEFVLGASKSLPMNASSISYNNTFVLSLSISTLERELPRCVINQLVKDGIDITIETNDLEVQDEEM